MKLFLLLSLFLLLLVSSVCGIIVSDDYDFKDRYNIYNVSNITAKEYYGSGEHITGLNTTHVNLTAESPLVLTGDVLSINHVYVNISGDTWQGNMNAGSYSLTNLGSLVMAGLITSKNIIPDTTELYTIGNSTHWYDEAYIKTLHSTDILTNNLNASEINSTDINSEQLNSDNVDIEKNLTFKNITIKEESGDFIIDLGG